MGFVLKKCVEFWLMPLPFCLLLLVFGLGLAWRGRRRGGWILVAVATALLFVFGNVDVSTRLVLPLERRYPPVADGRASGGLAACHAIVVLGSGNGDDPGLSATNRLSSTALARMTEGVRLLRLIPGAELIVSGPAVGRNPSHASVLEAAAVSLGVPAARIRRIEMARDTEEEALAVRALVGAARVALVTSAAHMPRAVALFRHAGVACVPCPTDFTARSNRDFRLSELFNEDPESLERSTIAVRERLGIAWERLRGQAD
ncbi:MAG: ElyC/SanA/YdcF family protein [Opitutaceae bacterium]